jgi:hypothetical protein
MFYFFKNVIKKVKKDNNTDIEAAITANFAHFADTVAHFAESIAPFAESIAA